jgi:hypothetical protein
MKRDATLKPASGRGNDWDGEAPGVPSGDETRASGVAQAATGTVTVHVPLTFARRGGRKRLLAPDGKPVVPAPRTASPPDTPVIRALARAFRWRKMIETGECATVREIAEAENVNASYVSRVLRLTLLAPGCVERLAEGRIRDGDLTVEALLRPFALRWDEQTKAFSKRSV